MTDMTSDTTKRIRRKYVCNLPTQLLEGLPADVRRNYEEQNIINQKLDDVMDGQFEAREGRNNIFEILQQSAAEFRSHEAQNTLNFDRITAQVAVTQTKILEIGEWRKTWFGRKGVLLAVVVTAFSWVIPPMVKSYLEHK